MGDQSQVLVGELRSRMDLVALAILLYVGLIAFFQISLVVDLDYLHEEFRLLFNYHQVADADLFAGDYITSYVDAPTQPYLYDGLTRLWLGLGGDLAVWHRLLPLVCWLAFLAGVMVAAGQIGDRLTALGALAIAVAQPLYFHQMTSALPHAFGFPLLIWALVALMRGSVLGTAAATLLAGLLYPAMAPLLGLLLAWQILVSQSFLSRPRAGQVKGLLLLAVTGAISIWLVLGALKGTDSFGAALEPLQQMETYPENGPEGRHFFGVFNPVKYVAAKAMVQFRMPSNLLSLLVLLAYCSVAAYGLFALSRNSAAPRALGVFVGVSFALGLAVFLMKPFFSYRFVLYPAFTVLPLLFMIGLQHFCLRLGPLTRAPRAAALGVLALLALATDSLDPRKLGYWWQLDPEHQAVVDFAAAQPPRTVFATWPGVETPLELLPYAAQRPLFVMRKAHYPNYENHILLMRARTEALIDAYLATDTAALAALNCRWGVDYLIVQKAHFAPEGARPRYFAPFDARIAAIWEATPAREMQLREPDPRWIALETEQFRVMDLRVVGQPDCVSAPPIEAPGSSL